MELSIYQTLCEIAGEKNVFCNEPMSRHTTFRVGGPAEILVTPEAKDLPAVMECCRRQQVPCLVIGNGSNLLCADAGVEGVVVEIGKQMAEISITENGQGTCEITAQAGALLSAIASQAAAMELTGFEFAAGIPGSIGGALVMNAGAYGGEMKDVLVEADVLTPEGEIRTIPASGLDLSYRHSNIPEKGYIVLSAKLLLKKGVKAEILKRMEELKEQRVSKQPLEYPSAGSTFKRPQGYFAGKLIDDAGLRGYTCGGAQVSEKHCGFVINRDHATAEDVRTLMSRVQQIVLEKYQIMLEPEVKFVGKF